MAHSLATHGLCTCGHLGELHELVQLLAFQTGVDYEAVGPCERCNCEAFDPNDTQICRICEDPNLEDDDE